MSGDTQLERPAVVQDLTARQPQSYVRAVLTRRKAFSWMYASAQGLG